MTRKAAKRAARICVSCGDFPARRGSAFCSSACLRDWAEAMHEGTAWCDECGQPDCNPPCGHKLKHYSDGKAVM